MCLPSLLKGPSQRIRLVRKKTQPRPPDLLDDDDTLHMRILGPYLLHPWRRAIDKVRSNSHTRLEGVVGAPSKGQDEDRAIFKVGPARRMLRLAAQVQIAKVYRVTLWPD